MDFFRLYYPISVNNRSRLRLLWRRDKSWMRRGRLGVGLGLGTLLGGLTFGKIWSTFHWFGSFLCTGNRWIYPSLLILRTRLFIGVWSVGRYSSPLQRVFKILVEKKRGRWNWNFSGCSGFLWLWIGNYCKIHTTGRKFWKFPLKIHSFFFS